MPEIPSTDVVTPTRRVGTLVLPGFSLLAQAGAVEPLMVANQLAGQPLYRVDAFSVCGDEVPSQASLSVAVDGPLESLPETLDLLILCAPAPLPAGRWAAVLGCLRHLAAHGVTLVGVSGGGELLVRAGVMDGYRATLPWQCFAEVARDFPRVRLSRQLFEIDRDRLTCGGGTAAMDMMMTLIAAHHGSALAERVSQHFVLERIRMADEPAPGPLRSRLGNAPPALHDAVQLMEANIEEPLTTHELAEHLGISRRQLERLFKRHLQAVPGRYYLDLRLQEARRLLHDTDWPAGEIAMKTGFSSPAHFSTAYRNHFGVTPREERLG
ncbi:GlxA family transcriptional regulator [Billgrantia gudaonensis]|uniref:Transcriptional regulator GlxA family, contains an amidase domain and an AraC-type DNA-binding HTH domain n=1 Tax=Billgrantia gudaonensis TaxID=376427 RepID=A0A1G9A4L5_9GAMM|nr:GlxA family transcriptional regulator [Halomonas gudaonensis]SDK22171.1 Transcriptional regulator GlxA family, contains an amidase domain and an AraC-type DNA-binding HTH domain [Halomonas gudaonensis]